MPYFLIKPNLSCSKSSYLFNIHLKPFLYGPAYFNGILFAYIIEYGQLEVFFRSPRTKTAINFIKTLVFFMIILVIMRDTVFEEMSIFSAIESSYLTMVMSFYLFHQIVDLAQRDSKLAKIMMSPLWRPFRSAGQIVYLIHMFIISILLDYFDLYDTLTSLINFPLFIISFIIFVIICYFVSIILSLIYEMPINGISGRLSSKLFVTHLKE